MIVGRPRDGWMQQGISLIHSLFDSSEPEAVHGGVRDEVVTHGGPEGTMAATTP